MNKLHRKEKVLIIDYDMNFMKELRKKLIAAYDFAAVDCITNSELAVKIIQSQQPDIIILNVIMPSVDGLSVLKQIDKMDLVIKPKVLMLSVILNDSIIAAAKKFGVRYFMLKPLNYDVLVDRIITLFLDSDDTIHTDLIDLNMSKNNNNNKPQSDEKVSLERMVTNVMHELGIPAHVKGYQYIRYAIILAVEDVTIMDSVTKELYPSVAAYFRTTASRVERAIRHAIEIAWVRGNTNFLNDLFGYTISNNKGKPTNSEFIALIADSLRIQLQEKVS